MSETSSLTTVQIGSTVLTVTDDAAAPDGSSVQLVDGLTVTEQLGDDQLWPMLPTGSASFSVFAPTVDDLTIGNGDGVRITYATPRAAGTVRLTFDGTVTDVSIRTHALGVVFDVVAVDRFTGAFAEQLVGDSPWPAESTEARVARIVALCGYMFDENVSAYPGWNAPVKARDVDSQPALGLLSTLLAGWTVDVTSFLFTNGLANASQLVANPAIAYAGVSLDPVIDAGTLVITEWEANPTLSAHVAGTGVSSLLPGVFADTGDGWGVVMVTADDDPVAGENRSDKLVSTDYVDMGARFTRRKGALPNTVALTGWWGAGVTERTVTVNNGDDPPVLFRVSTELTDIDDAERAARTYLPEAGPTTDWLADTFVWRWYGEDTTDRFALPQIGDPLAVAEIQDRHNPTGRPWYAGQLVARSFKLSAARPVVDLTIRPQLRRTVGSNLALHSWLDFPDAVTWADLNDRDTWDDYRLLRG